MPFPAGDSIVLLLEDQGSNDVLQDRGSDSIRALPNTACTRPPIRFEFQGYSRVVIILRGAGVVCRTLGGE